MTDEKLHRFVDQLRSSDLSPHIVTDQDAIAPWLTDWRGRFHGRSPVMVEPRSTEETAFLVRTVAEHKVAIVPQGGNSGMVGGATPDQAGDAVLLSMRRMNAIRQDLPEEHAIIAEAGVILQNLHEHLEGAGLRFPLTLGGKGSATIGGLVSTNAGGTQVLRHGTMRALVAGVEAVLPNGSVFDGLAALKKDNRGYDLNQLLVGAEGTLGIVTAARLRLCPAVVDRCVIWAGVETPSAARKLLLFLEREAGSAMEGFEIMPQHCIDNVLQHIPGTRAPLAGNHDWHCLVEIVRDDAGDMGSAQRAESIMARAMERGLINDAAMSASEAQAEAFWKIRDSIAEAERAEGPAVQHDISVPVADMARFIETVAPETEKRFPGSRAVAFGHMGDGNVHYHVTAPTNSDADQWYAGAAKDISQWVYDQVAAWNGSLSAEHGIGQLKRDELERLGDPARLFALRAVKKAFDPDQIMNPGKLINLASPGDST
ncbi:FAD-binding oxidoreductase [Alterisphingorhabdus coralli]|uniref:FAD-binding oxidoreductase n=1 Tax=Alterisphingorhabdus coralli TaxID=3071408 RepID=A0AA97I2L7_9SPHN|nr:FAD-binding oxidoreductase [Parasphingorhabdus sp. SCSIO 66989]WOE76383.1 FAD-binding oxidoreductase [Parasphingorhabdus sp. SCSIO 66989]